MLSKFIHIKTWLLAAALVWLIHSVATVEAADPVVKSATTASAPADHAGTGDAAGQAAAPSPSYPTGMPMPPGGMPPGAGGRPPVSGGR